MRHSNADANKSWGGRFREGLAEDALLFSDSQKFDRALYRHDILGSKAHARMLCKNGILSENEAAQIISGLDKILAEIEAGQFVWKSELEDVHMNIEARLTELIGQIGKKLHTGRSRNDQVALAFRLYIADSCKAWIKLCVGLCSQLAKSSEANISAILPGLTHFQPAQPVSLAQHLLAYAAMFRRDVERIENALSRIAVSPLGAAALAGSTFPLQPSEVAEEVNFSQIFSNSMDAVSDRDFVTEAIFCAAMIAMHLSRLCEEIIIWSNPGFGFVILPDSYSTGSSIMPQKKNPDFAELIRGKTGRIYGDLIAMLTILKALPLTYNRDLQEDKENFFDADNTIQGCLKIISNMFAKIHFDTDRMRNACSKGYINATELADYLAQKGVPFREAHHITGAIVAYAESRRKPLEGLQLNEFRQFSALIEEDIYKILDYAEAVKRRETPGGTGPESVRRQLDELYGWLNMKV